jgi:surface protein
MSGMFSAALAFNQPIGSWNVSNVTVMSGMFTSAIAFNQPIGTWNVGNVTIMQNMFNGATNFNQDIGGWNTSNVANMSGMFRGTNSFNCGQPSGVVHDLMQRTSTGGWKTQGIVSSGMTNMFNGALAFAGNISNWCVTGIASAPTSFAAGANANFTVALQPTWGSCPFPD